MDTVKKYLPHAVTFLFGLCAVLLISGYRGAFGAEGAAVAMAAVCDGLFTVGVLFVGIGLLITLSGGGAFDMLKFSVGLLFSLFSKEKRKDKDFYSYSERKKEERKDRKGVSHLLLIGGLFLLCSVGILIGFKLY